ncbi:MAG: hypothetical protein RL685_1749 [Pseudomonadota bacterium]
MKRVTSALCGLAVVGALGASLWGLNPSVPATASRASAALGKSELEPSQAASGSGSAGANEEVLRLRAELRQKDALLRALAKRQAAQEAASEPAAAPEEQALDPVARTVDVLDERLHLAPADPRKAAEMEHAVREAVDAATLNDAKISSFYCTGALCKLTLAAPTQEAMAQSLQSLSGKLSKTITNTLVLDLSNGESAMYLAQSSEALDVPPN